MKINYKLIGEGKETVLFLHGWGANLNSFLFCENALKNNYKLLLVDFPGFGESEKLNNVFSVFDYALEIFKLLTKLEINNVNIVCHSFGGRVAMLLSTIFNLKVNKLVLIDAAGIKPRFNLKTKLKIFKKKKKKFLNKFKFINFNLNSYGSEDYKKLSAIEKQTFIKVVNFNEVKYCKQIASKTLIIWGRSDCSTPIYMAKKFKKSIANSKLIIIKNAGHFCFLEYPSVVVEELESFLMFN